jgi:CBS domain-containing protein
VPVEACAACEEGAGLRAGAGGQPAEVLCRFEGGCGPASSGRDDIFAELHADPISGIMTRAVICVGPEMSASEVRRVVIERGISGVPVVDAEGRPIGVVSKTDLLRVEGPRGWQGEEGAHGPALERPDERPGSVGSIMTAITIAIHETSTIAQAAALMAYEGVHRLPVIDDGQRVVGLLSSLDVLHWIGRRSGYLMRPVADRVD